MYIAIAVGSIAHRFWLFMLLVIMYNVSCSHRVATETVLASSVCWPIDGRTETDEKVSKQCEHEKEARYSAKRGSPYLEWSKAEVTARDWGTGKEQYPETRLHSWPGVRWWYWTEKEMHQCHQPLFILLRTADTVSDMALYISFVYYL